jgi:hypothetical protein
VKISFHVSSEPLMTRIREVVVLPRVGEYVAWHRDNESNYFRVLKIIHVMEDREDHRVKGQPRESACLVVERVDRSEFQAPQSLDSPTLPI